MQTRFRGFNYRAQLSGRRHKTDEARAEICRSIDAFTGTLEHDEVAEEGRDWANTLNPVTYSRRVILPLGQHTDPEAISAMNELFACEEDCLNEAQGLTLSEMIGAEDDDAEVEEPYETKTAMASSATRRIGPARGCDESHMMQFRAIHDKIRQSIDRVTFTRGYNSLAETLRAGRRLPLYAQVLLLDFFDTCRFPNDAEMWMLAEACGVGNVNVPVRWFAARRQQTARMYSADVAQDGQERRARTVLIKELFGEANVPVR